jgi:hypothetical protein
MNVDMNKTYMRNATSGAGTEYPSGAPEFIPVFSGVRVTRSLVLCVCFVDFAICIYCKEFSKFILNGILSNNTVYGMKDAATLYFIVK